MEPLTHRSPNVIGKQNTLSKKEAMEMQASADKKSQKDKEHPPKPPYYVSEPDGPNGVSGERYKTGSLLGKGGFAICYKAELCNERYGDAVHEFALKIVKTHMNQKKMLEKFRTELQIHSKLRHPNIVEFHRAFTFQESTYVVLELCQNGSVMDMVRQRRCLSLPEVRRITIQLCGAIKYMHKRNVIHRDLKMGNLFLDANMNIKVGDFGLAAILVTDKEAGFARRTTLCGTPNYIAPEILEKGRRGHDHKVDIWAIGVIVFAMLTGYPPFQSNTQDEIYRKVKDLNYAWPIDIKFQNYIPEEAKSLVKSLLKVEAIERPEPDDVVRHEFFLMHDGNGIPGFLDPSCRRGKPSWLANRQPLGDSMDTKVKVLWRDICRECGVGREPGSEPYPVVGRFSTKTLYKQCVEEEFHGRTPIVPVPEDMVYISYPGPARWPPLSEGDLPEHRDIVRAEKQAGEPPTCSKTQNIPSKMQQSENKGLSDLLTTGATLRNQPSGTTRPRRTDHQSHAAQLRQKDKPVVKGILKSSRPRPFPTTDSTTRPAPTPPTTVPEAGPTRGLLSDLPVRRPPRSISSSSVGPSRTQEAPRLTRSNTAPGELKGDFPELNVSGKRGSHESSTPNPGNVGAGPHDVDVQCDSARRTRSATVRGEVGAAVVAEREDAFNAEAGDLHSNPSIKPRSGRRVRELAILSRSPQVLIGAHEAAEDVPFTTAVSVRQALKIIYTNLGDAMDTASSSKNCGIEVLHTRPDSMRDRLAVSKWVDYTNKFGIGYILNEGTVGCVFKGENGNPPTCIAVRGGESHLKKRTLDTYPEKHQIVPKEGQPIEFFENRGDLGIKRVAVPSSEFQIEVGKGGIAEKFGPGKDSYEYQKRKSVWLYDKFANYMTKGLGKSEDVAIKPPKAVSLGKGKPSRTSVRPFVKFYQRVGNVGVWGFGNGSFQFNFPDHTKLIISHDGKWVDFYHLPAAAATHLSRNRVLPKECLDNRDMLSYPVPILLQGHFSPKGRDPHSFEDIVVANQLKEKLAFVRDVARRWYTCGGIGCLGEGEGSRMRWEGLAERGAGGKAEKMVWVSIGARGGDLRYEEVVEQRNSGLGEDKRQRGL